MAGVTCAKGTRERFDPSCRVTCGATRSTHAVAETSTYDRRMARVGAVVRRGEDYGVVTEVDDHTFDVVVVEWDDGSTEKVQVADLEWIISRE